MSWRASDDFRLPASYYDPPDERFDEDDGPDPDEQRERARERQEHEDQL